MNNEEFDRLVSEAKKFIEDGRSYFVCENTFQIATVAEACKLLGRKYEKVKVTEKVKFSCKDWERFNGSI